MTPQVARPDGGVHAPGQGQGRMSGRYSYGGAAQRVMVEQTWRVRDIVLPTRDVKEGPDVGAGAVGVVDGEGRGRGRGRERLSDEERKVCGSSLLA